MSSLDPSTMALVAGLVSVLQTLAFFVLWRFNRQMPGVGSWGWAALFNGTGMVLLTLRAFVDSAVLTKILPSFLNSVAALLFYFGAAAFAGHRPRWQVPVAAAVPLFLGFVWFFLVQDQPRVRPFLITPVFLLFIAPATWHLLQEQRPGLRFSARFTGVAVGVLSLLLFYRLVSLQFLPSTTGLLDPVGPHQTLFMGMVVFALIWTFGTMLLINQRQILEVRQSSEAALRAREEAAALQQEVLAERAHRQRQLLVRDLHDGLGGITAHLALLSSGPDGGEASTTRTGRIEDIQQLAQEGNRELRLLMNTLERGVTHWGDFLSEIRTHADRVSAAHGLPLRWTVTGRVPSEPSEDAPALLSLQRAVKEALNNAARHAHASRISAHITFRSQGLGILIRDDGRGFVSSTAPGRGRGLGNMHRRIEEMGGRCRIVSRPGTGTSVRFILPLPVALATVPTPSRGGVA